VVQLPVGFAQPVHFGREVAWDETKNRETGKAHTVSFEEASELRDEDTIRI
jgi:uncharacterized DUF497 family protein